MNIFAFLVSLFASFFAGVIAHDTHSIKNRKYIIRNKRINKSFSFALLSDLHGCVYGDNNDVIIDRVNSSKPDAVIIAGDMINAKFSFKYEAVFGLINELSKICPVYYGIGNHESRLKWDEEYGLDYDEFKNGITKAGAIVLDNSELLLDEYNIVIKGLTLDRKYYKKMQHHILTPDVIETGVGQMYEDKCNIMIAHNPEYFKAYSDYGADIILSGHLHGGIMGLPLGKGFISPRFKLLPKYCGGVFKRNNTAMIVSRGLGQHSLPIRVFNECELCFIKIKR